MLSKLKIIILLITFIFIWSCGDKVKKISEIVEVDMEMQMSNAYKEGYYFHSHLGQQNLQLWQPTHIILKIITVMQFLS